MQDLEKLAIDQVSSAVNDFMSPVLIDNKSYFVNLVNFDMTENQVSSNHNFTFTIYYNVTGFDFKDIEIFKKLNPDNDVNYLFSEIESISIRFNLSN